MSLTKGTDPTFSKAALPKEWCHQTQGEIVIFKMDNSIKCSSGDQ